MTHTSKTNWWIVASIVLAVIVLLVGRDYWIVGPVLLVLLLCAYPQSYQTAPQGLLVRTALSRLTIPYRTITFVGPHDGSGPHGHGVKIRYGLASELVIALANRDAFLSDMAKRTPHLTRLGRKLVAVFA